MLRAWKLFQFTLLSSLPLFYWWRSSNFKYSKPKKAIVNDSNKELIASYQLIKEKPQELIKLLTEYEKKHSKDFYEQSKQQEVPKLTESEISARFIYLNKTGFNSLYRVNSQGLFNVPWGQKPRTNCLKRITF